MSTPTIICMDCDQPLLINTIASRESEATCPICKTKWECAAIIPPQAKPDLTPTPKVEDTTASCFNHGDNKAEAECSCGKLLCKVCTFSQSGKHLCVNCFISDKQNTDLKKTRLIRYDLMANYAIGLTFITLGLAAPLVVYFIVQHFTKGEKTIYQSKSVSFVAMLFMLGMVLLIDALGIYYVVRYFASYVDANH